MKVKLVAIGNAIMGDDGIALKVAESIRNELEQEGISVIIGETDTDYCLSEITDCDLVFILDATCFGTKPGSVSISSLDNIKCESPWLFQHGLNLIMLIQRCKLQTSCRIDSIYVIGIEAESIEFSLNISSTLCKEYNTICEKVVRLVFLRYNITER